jgi:hypothetical protein
MLAIKREGKGAVRIRGGLRAAAVFSNSGMSLKRV